MTASTFVALVVVCVLAVAIVVVVVTWLTPARRDVPPVPRRAMRDLLARFESEREQHPERQT